jgi:hypothetical protein
MKVTGTNKQVPTLPEKRNNWGRVTRTYVSLLKTCMRRKCAKIKFIYM